MAEGTQILADASKQCVLLRQALDKWKKVTFNMRRPPRLCSTASVSPLCRVEKILKPLALSVEIEEVLEREKGLVITGCDTALLFEFAEHTLDTIAILIAAIVEMFWCFPV